MPCLRMEADNVELAFEATLLPLSDQDRFAHKVTTVLQPFGAEVVKVI